MSFEFLYTGGLLINATTLYRLEARGWWAVVNKKDQVYNI